MALCCCKSILLFKTVIFFNKKNEILLQIKTRLENSFAFMIDLLHYNYQINAKILWMKYKMRVCISI